jgi:hypothetical protein
MIREDINKAVILTRVDTALLIKIVKGGEHLRRIAARELCRRGWRGEVGFILDNQSTKGVVPQCCSGGPDIAICHCHAHWHPHRRGPECKPPSQPTKAVDNEHK